MGNVKQNSLMDFFAKYKDWQFLMESGARFQILAESFMNVECSICPPLDSDNI